MDIQAGSITCKNRHDSRRRRVWRMMSGVWVLLHVTVILYCFSVAPAGMNLLKNPSRSIREICPRRRLDTILKSANLFEVSEKFLAQAQITELQTVLHAGPLDHSMQQMSAGAEKHNVLYVLNEDGLQRGSLEPSLLQLFQQMRHPKANFWKYQVKWLTGISKGAEGELGTRKIHADQWVLRNGTDTCRLLAFQTSILYISVPKMVRGGDLSLFKKGTAGSGPTFINLIKLSPAENMLISFQGDIPHQVEEIETEDPTPRVSIALEQFFVPQDLYDLTVEFDVIRSPGATAEADSNNDEQASASMQ